MVAVVSSALHCFHGYRHVPGITAGALGSRHNCFLGALMPFHPFDLLYNYGARYITGTRSLPHHGPQRRFACGIAFVWLIATGWAFHSGAATLGYVLGVPLILVAALVSITHFCIPSLIYNTLFRRKAGA